MGKSSQKSPKKTMLRKDLFIILTFLLPLQLGKHLWPSFSYVLGLRIDYLSPTVYLTDILVLGLLGLWGWEKLRDLKVKKIKKITLGKLIFPSSVLLFLFVNVLWAQKQGVALYKFAKVIEFFLLGVYVVKNRISLSTIARPLSLAITYSSIIALLQFIKQSSLDGVFWWLGERTFSLSTPGIAKAIYHGRLLLRPYATFPHPNALAGFLLTGLILTFPFLWRGNKLVVIGYLLIVVGAIIISFSRSVWLVGLLVNFCWLQNYFSRKKINKSSRLSKYWLPITFLCGLLIIISGLFLILKIPFSTSESVTQRLELIKTAILMIKNHPLVGVGLNNFLVQLPELWQRPTSVRLLQPVHNIYLLITAETGLIGLLISGWFLVMTYKRFLSRKNSKQRLDGGLVGRKDISDGGKPNISKPMILSRWNDTCALVLALSAILLLGFFDHYWLTLQQNQLLFTLVLGLGWSPITKEDSRYG